MSMLRLMCGLTRKDNVKTEYTRGADGVAKMSSKVTERWLEWCGHVRRRLQEHACGQIMGMHPPERKNRKTEDKVDGCCGQTHTMVAFERKMADDRIRCRRTIDDHCGGPRWPDKPDEQKRVVCFSESWPPLSELTPNVDPTFMYEWRVAR